MTRIKRNFAKIFSKLAAISGIICVIIFFLILKKDFTFKTLMSLFTSSTTAALILWGLWEKVLWKVPGIKLLDPIPNFSGRWKGYYKRYGPESDHKKHGYVLEIKQTYSSIQCSTYQDSGSTSSGVIAELCTLSDEKKGLIFYWNGDSTTAEQSENLPKQYKGVTVLTYTPPSKNCKAKFKGSYFTNRETSGKVDIEFVDQELLHQFDIPADTPTPVTK